jgi:hypothetical protein
MYARARLNPGTGEARHAPSQAEPTHGRKRVESRRPRQAGGPPTRASVSRAGLRLLRKQGPQGFGARRGSKSSRLPPELENRRPSRRGRAAQAGGAAGGGCDARSGCTALRLNRGLRFVKPALSTRRCLRSAPAGRGRSIPPDQCPGDPELRRSGVHARLGAPDRAGPGGLLKFAKSDLFSAPLTVFTRR